jgi:DNA-binding NarL/FixJ family response regulator
VGLPVDTGNAALRAGRWAEARDAFRQALSESETPAAHSGLGQALWWLGEMPASVAAHERGYAGFRRAGARVEAAMSAMTLSITYSSNFGDHAAAGGWAARAQRLLAGEQDPALRSLLHLTLGYATPELVVAERQRARALELARQSGDADLELCGLTALGEALVMAGRVAEGLRLVDEAMAAALAGEPARLDTVAYTCCDMIVACSVAGDLERAAQWCRLADGFIARYGCPFLYARCRISYGSLLVAKGDWARAESELVAAAAMAASAGPALETQAVVGLAELRLRQGRTDEAATLLAAVGDAAVAAGATATLHLARGRPDLAGAVLQRRLRTGGDRSPDAAPLLAMLAEAQAAADEVVSAGRTAEQLTEHARHQDHDLPRALAAEATGVVSAAAGDPATAVRCLETALGTFSSLGRPFETARVRRRLAESLAAGSAEVAVVEARRALEAFETLGAALEADATAALLRSLGAPGRRAPRSGTALTGRETEVLRLVGLGLSNPEIAQRLHISRKTAAHHVSAVLLKLGVRRRAEAAAVAARQTTGGAATR